MELNPIYSLDLENIAAALQSADFATQIEHLKSLKSPGIVFEFAREIATDICLNSPMLIPEGIEKEKVKRALVNADYEGTPSSSDDYWKLLGVGMTKEYIARGLINEVVNGENKLNLSETEKIVILGSNEIANSFDRLYREWRQQVVTSPFAQKLKDMGSDKALDYLKSQNAIPGSFKEYLYLVFSEEEGQVITQSYSEAFPEAVSQAADSIQNIINKLDQTQDPDWQYKNNLETYFFFLKQALLSNDPEQHENLYETVEKAWSNLNGRIIPIHMMETYDNPWIVEPEFALMFRDDRYKDVEQLIKRSKQGIMTYLSQNFGNLTSVKSCIPMIQAADEGVYAFAVKSGKRIEFMNAGQNLVNREKIRKEYGARIFVIMESMWQRWNTEKEYLKKLFGSQKVKELETVENQIVAMQAGLFVGGHEDAHNAFIDEGTREGLGADNFNNIEEHKADHTVVAASPEFINDANEAQLFLWGYLASITRDLSLRQKDSSLPYYYSGLIALNIMDEVKLLTKNDGEFWNFDLSEEKITAFIEKSRNIEAELANVYENKNSQKASEYIQKYYRETPFVRSLLQDLGFSDSPNPASIAKVVEH